MSSPAGLHFSQADFLARWMPNSSRAGVILAPCTGVSSAPRLPSAEGPNDSFVSDFGPLPASADSSCVAADGCPRPPGGDTAGSDGPLKGRSPDGELDSLDPMERPKQPPTLTMKLEQLRKWQEHMQEQLQAQQLEELLRLQEEQQRLLGKMNGSQDYDAGSTQSEEYEDEDRSLSYQQSDILPPNNETLTEDCTRGEDKACNDRPIKGQKKTFEELLEEQLKLEEQRLKSAEQQSQTGADTLEAPPKRAFLKRGEGLSRFTNRRSSSSKTEDAKDPKPGVLAKVISRSNSEPAVTLRGSKTAAQRLPVQRKTASLNKENRQRGFSSSPQQIGRDHRGERTKVLGSHQRQNTDRAASLQTDQGAFQNKPPRAREGKEREKSKVGLAARVTPEHGTLPGPFATRGGAMKPPARSEDEAGENRSEENPQSSGDEVPEEVLELSFQEKLQRWECDHHAESMELGEFELLEQAAEELSFSSNSSFVTKILQMDRMRAVHGLPPRRLSSTPVKAPPKGEIRRCSSLGSSGFEDCKADLMNSDALKNKVSVQDAEEERRVFADVWPCGYHSEGQEILTKAPFPESKQPYDKRSYQDEDSASEASQSDDAEGTSVLSTAESTLIEDKDEQDRVVFDDNDTWNDQEDTVVPTARESPPPQRTLLRKVAVLDKGAVTGSTNQKSDPPPASELMTKLFPSLKPKTQNAPVPPAPESKQPQEESGQSVQSRLLRERLVELEIEIERFKKENAALTKLREENEKNRDVLRKERLEFEQMKAVELAKLEEYKKEENRRLQKERRIFERHASAARAMPDKKEREEIQLLKQQLSSLQEELKGKESRWASAHNRLRQQIDSLRQENASLRDETRVLEKLRLNALKNNVANAEKVQKMSPKMLENSTSTISKGVKFASPLDSRGSGNPPQSSMAAAARKNSKEGGIKSSLRKPAASESSSTSLSRTVERSTTAGKSQEKSSNPENSHSCSPKHNVLPNEVGSELKEAEPADQVITHSDGKTEKVLTNGDRLVVFSNGTKKEVSADGQTVKVTFFNGDTKEITDQRVIYFYAEAQTTHVTYPDGIEVLHFPNNQTEKHFPDGRKEITFPDQTVKNLFPGGREESVLTDGTVIQVNPDGSKEIHFNTGQREIHTADYKRREYPDGTVKTVYNDGRQETRYPTGRLRVKDKDGNVVVDSRG